MIIEQFNLLTQLHTQKCTKNDIFRRIGASDKHDKGT